jgi:hypothetical protein
MNNYCWKRSSWPENRKPYWKKTDWLSGGTVEMHRDWLGQPQFVKRNIFGDVAFRGKPWWKF